MAYSNNEYNTKWTLIRTIEENKYSKFIDILLDTPEKNMSIIVNEKMDTGLTALMVAINKLYSRNQFDPDSDYKHMDKYISRLIGYGANVNAVDESNTTALMHFLTIEHDAYESSEKIFQTLLEKTDDVNIQNASGDTALMLAIKNGSKNEWAFVKPLLEKSNCSLKNRYGDSALFSLIDTYSREHDGRMDIRSEIAQMLIDCGDSVNNRNSIGTVLELAVLNNVNPIVEILIMNDATLTEPAKEMIEESENPFLLQLLQFAEDRERAMSSVDDSTLTLYSASFRGNVAKVQEILKKGETDINLVSSTGLTPLMVAASRKHVRVVEELLKYPEIEVNKQDGQGNTALHYATIAGNSEIVGLLLAAGAERTILNKHGMRPFRYSRKSDIKTLLAVPFKITDAVEHHIGSNISFQVNSVEFNSDFDEDLVNKALNNNDLCNTLNPDYVRKAMDTCDISILLIQDSETLGIALLFVKDATLYVDIFCTNPQYKGVGAYLMGLLKRVATALSLTNVSLCSVQSAVGFYEKMQFGRNDTVACGAPLVPMRFRHAGGKRKTRVASLRKTRRRRRTYKRKQSKRQRRR